MFVAENSRPWVTVLSGFLGAGKTTLLRHVLGQSEGRRWAAVVNDVAAINVDAQLVTGTGASRVVELANGCVCCSVRDELAETIAELATSGDFERIIVETTGVAEPRAVADLFVRKNSFGRSLDDFARLEALVTVVDARDFLAAREKIPTALTGGKKPVFELMLDQVECADVLVVNKCDLVTAEELRELREILCELNPRAEILSAEQGQVPSEALFGRPRFQTQETLGAAKWIRLLNGQTTTERSKRAPVVRGLAFDRSTAVTHEVEYGITSFVFEARRPFVKEQFFGWLEKNLPRGLLRAKGFFWLADQPADIGFLSIAGGLARREFIGTWTAALRERGTITAEEVPAAARAKWIEPHGDRRQELVFIGIALDETALCAALSACLEGGVLGFAF